MLYLGSPYTHKLAEVRELRYRAVEEACAWFHNRNVVVYSPIMHWHNCAVRLALPTHAEPWETQNYGILSCSYRMGVLQLEGWKSSVGLKGEVQKALGFSIPVIGYQMIDREVVKTGLLDITDFE